jgi:putative Holliday junction resolvase
MRYLALDLGDKRTGLALGDSDLRMAAPAGVLEVALSQRAGEALLEAVAKEIDRQLGPGTGAGGPGAVAAGEIVVGLPLNMDGSQGARAALVRRFATRLGARTGCTIHFFDERLSSAAADWTMARSGLTHRQKKERRDALAAAAILQGFLDSLPR